METMLNHESATFAASLAHFCIATRTRSRPELAEYFKDTWFPETETIPNQGSRALICFFQIWKCFFHNIILIFFNSDFSPEIFEKFTDLRQ